MKTRVTNRTGLAHLLAALMIFAVSSRVWITHDRGYYEELRLTANSSQGASESIRCNCPICHAEDYLATEAEYFDYHPFVTTLLCEFGIQPTSSASRTILATSLRGPPCLS